MDSFENLDQVRNRLKEVLGHNYRRETDDIVLDRKNKSMKVEYEEEQKEQQSDVIPLFRDVLYQKSAYVPAMFQKNLKECPVIAFHSYKGGVGRTLSLLSFAKAWSSIFAGNYKQKRNCSEPLNQR